jgi:hypothetical protein
VDPLSSAAMATTKLLIKGHYLPQKGDGILLWSNKNFVA